MCGIAGFSGNGNNQMLKNMIDSIKYRGPDAQVIYSDEHISLSHARLSIIDLSQEGNQPMFSVERDTIITFNGEIYNYLELKKDLEKKYSFKTSTDTEVLLCLYQEYGVNMLEKINGMFAFAIYDYKENILFIARDRMGKKPLYYAQNEEAFVFASELKAILQHGSIKKELNIEAVNQYLTFDYVPTPNTIINDVYKLEPASYIIVKDHKIEVKKQYWGHQFLPKSDLSFKDAAEKLDHFLNEATKKRLMSDVPLGVFLSGGLDSSAIAYYAQKNSKSKIKTFSIGFEDKSYDEASYAQKVAKHLGSQHYQEILTPTNTLSLIDEIFLKVDEPFADASIIPTYFLSQFTRQHVTVALGGDGSDELMAGYPTFISDKFKSPFSFLPNQISNGLLDFASNLLPVSDKNISFDFKVKQFLRGFSSEKNHIHQLWLGSFTSSEKKLLFRDNIYSRLKDKKGFEIIDFHFNNSNEGWSDFEKITFYYYKTYLLDDIFVKVDRASMFNSLEVRAPFMDKDLVEFLNSLPQSYKIKGLESKFLLKKTMEGKLPNDIIYRNKKGFGIPLSDWIRKDLKVKIYDTLMQKDELFNEDYIKLIWDNHLAGKSNNRKLIWNLFVLKKYLIQNDLL